MPVEVYGRRFGNYSLCSMSTLKYYGRDEGKVYLNFLTEGEGEYFFDSEKDITNIIELYKAS